MVSREGSSAEEGVGRVVDVGTFSRLEGLGGTTVGEAW